jgi:hypothetical protein
MVNILGPFSYLGAFCKWPLLLYVRYSGYRRNKIRLQHDRFTLGARDPFLVKGYQASMRMVPSLGPYMRASILVTAPPRDLESASRKLEMRGPFSEGPRNMNSSDTFGVEIRAVTASSTLLS